MDECLQITFPSVCGGNNVYTKVLGAILGSTQGKNVIDLCCGESHFIRHFPFAKKVYVDIVDRGLNNPVEQQHFILADVLGDHPALSEHYDYAMCMDGIEHFRKDKGHLLLERMNKLADKAILFTPLDPWCMSDENDTAPESHKSIWKPEELTDYAHVIFPTYHDTLGIGAFFFWRCDNLEEDFNRVKQILQKGF